MPAESPLTVFEAEFRQIISVLDKLVKEANAKVVFIVDKDGHLISASGETENIDTVSLASLTAGNIAATSGIAKLLGEKEFSILFHEGEKDNLHLSIIAERVILVVLFDSRSSLGLVRLRVKKATEELTAIFQKLMGEAARSSGSAEALLREITDEDIDKLFH
ncbi:MAG: dynein regulation protein LC7 [Deltaproteobacteria bacterium GWC2_42_11]|nr:MAG: dynein regulation protein LC7 [Deltaproteobacteria bacterium GWC2_42_11]HBO84803.1 dynein regulation protein LC7 [Deltaproteobacteria bacterium]